MKGLVALHAVDVDNCLEKMNSKDKKRKLEVENQPRTFKTLHRMLKKCPEEIPENEKNIKFVLTVF